MFSQSSRILVPRFATKFSQQFVACAALIIVAAIGQSAWAQASNPPETPPCDSQTGTNCPSGQTLERIQITGTNITRSDAATAQNVQVLTADDIKQSGKATVADLLHTISANFASYNETFSNSFSPGAGSIALRGLSQKNTLVLLNGQRIAVYGFAQNLEDTYVDLNIIPANAVERIEILKEGASSVYGSDAIAGVVNIILRSDYHEKTVEVGYGQGPAGNEKTRDTTATFGFGSLEADGWNTLIAASYLKRSEVLASQVPYIAQEDYRSHPGGQFNWGTLSAYVNDNNPNAPQSPLPNCTQQGGTVLPLTLFPTSAVGSVCGFNQASQTDEIPETERTALVSNTIFKISPNLVANADIFLSNVRTYVTGTPAGLGPTAVAFDPTTGGVTPVNNTLPVGNPSNPNATPTGIIYTFNSVGDQNYIVRSNTARLNGQLKWTFGDWDMTVNAGVSENDVTQTNYNAILVGALQTAIATGSYDFIDPASTPGGSNALRTSFNQTSVSKLETTGLKFSGPLFALPAGDVEAAFGTEYRHESIDDQPDHLITTGQIVGFGATQVDGARSVDALYAEVNVPIFKSLEANLAARAEDYSDAGLNYSPKLALRWQPVESLVLRGTISRGFRAPSLPEISNASSTAFVSVSDPQDPLGRPSETIAEVIQANPHLKPEKSTNSDIGFVFSPTKNESVAMDFYKISVHNVVAAETTAQSLVDDPTAFPGQIVRTPGGLLNYVIVPYENLYSIETQGIDFNVEKRFPLGGDRSIRFDLGGTYVDRLAVNSSPGGALQNYAGTDGWLIFSPVGGGGPVPRLRGSLSSTYEDSTYVGKVSVNYIAGYTEVVCALLQGYCGGASPSSEGAAANVASQTTVDLYAEYRGIKHWTLSAAVTNLLNRRPPFDAYDFPFEITMYDVTGRFVSFHAEYRF